MSKINEKNFNPDYYPDDDEIKTFIDSLSEKNFIEEIRRDEERNFFKASVLKKYIENWLERKIIKPLNSVSEFIEILNSKEQALNPNSPSYYNKKRQIQVLKNQLSWFLSTGQIQEVISIEELLIYLKNLIDEKKKFLNNKK